MSQFEQIWQFDTKHFRVVLECEPEQDPDMSWADEETLDKLEQGIYQNVCFRVRVLLHGSEIAADYLSNSVYENVDEFRTEHIRGAAAAREARARGVLMGSYFPQMVRNAISEARSTLATPRLRQV